MKKSGNHHGCMVVIVLLAIFSFTTPVWSASYFLYDQWGGTWHDANKTYVDDRLMCWAASASNILDWGNWDADSYTTETMIFANIKYHWTDNRGWTSWAWQWWLNGTLSPYTSYSYVNVPGGGNYFPQVNLFSYYAAQYGGMQAIDSLMQSGHGISVVITKSANSHAVTCWGFDYALVNGVKNYTSIYITDSDDRVTALRNYGLIYNNGWYLTGGYSGWKITSVYGLAQYTNLIAANASLITGAGPAPGTPLAPTWILVGPALLVLIILQTRYQKNIRKA